MHTDQHAPNVKDEMPFLNGKNDFDVYSRLILLAKLLTFRHNHYIERSVLTGQQLVLLKSMKIHADGFMWQPKNLECV